MPFADRMARVNRRIMNPLIQTFAGWLPPLAIIVHRGRRSGKEYHTPVMAFPAGGEVVIALTYGVNRDWVRNVRVAGGCDLIRSGHRYTLTDPRLGRGSDQQRFLPYPIRLMLRFQGVTEFLWLRPGQPMR